MTLLGAPPSFSIGSNVPDPTNMSLDDRIAHRRKQDKVDRSIATGRAKRDARMKAKRGLTNNNNDNTNNKNNTNTKNNNNNNNKKNNNNNTKPTAMQIEQEVDKERQKTARKRAVQKKTVIETKTKKATTPAQRRALAQAQQEERKAVKKNMTNQNSQVKIQRPPRKYTRAALQAMSDYQVPEGMRVSITLEPVVKNNNNTTKQQQQQQPKTKSGRGKKGKA